MKGNNFPEVSVCVICYNQEKYLGNLIDSILSQKLNFNFEIIIGDDFSSDNSKCLIEDYMQRYPDIIFSIFNRENLGVIENIKAVYKKARGKYICHLDGDDYALPTKLQKQFDILEKNPDCSICSHSMQFVDKNGEYVKTWSHPEGKFSLDYLCENLPFFAHSSKMFRNDFTLKYLDELHPQALDIEMHIAQAKQGDIYHIDEELGAYRVDVGISYINKKINPILPLGVMRAYEQILLEEQNSHKLKKYKKKYAEHMFQFTLGCLKTRSDYDLYCKVARKSFLTYFYNRRQFIHYIVSLFPKKLYEFLSKK